MSLSQPTKKNHITKYERRALCHSCHLSNLVCTAHPNTGLPECAGCKDKRENPRQDKAQGTSSL